MSAPMDLYCVMGNPVAHSKSPWIHARFAEATGQRLRYERRLVEPGRFAQTVREFMHTVEGHSRGCNITVPFKFEAAALADETSARARLAEAVNTLSFRDGRIHADNTDGEGLVRDIERNAKVDIQGRELLLIGAGGAAAGVLAPLLAARPARLTVVNRTASKAAGLVARHAAVATRHGVRLQVQDLAAVQGRFDLLVNASASSLAGDAVPVPASVLAAGALAVDMMYGPAAAGFLAWARGHGAVARDGLGMLVEQAAAAFEIWRGVRPPSGEVLAELRAQLDAPRDAQQEAQPRAVRESP